MKSEFICVKPKSISAKVEFEQLMNLLHSCKVQKRQDGKMLVSSISGNHRFWISEMNDIDWEIVK